MKQSNYLTSASSNHSSHSAIAGITERHALEICSNEERERLRKLLHDGLGQMLTSATFVASSLRQRLAELGLAETEMADDVIGLLKEAIAESHSLATRCKTPPMKMSIGSTRAAGNAPIG